MFGLTGVQSVCDRAHIDQSHAFQRRCDFYPPVTTPHISPLSSHPSHAFQRRCDFYPPVTTPHISVNPHLTRAMFPTQVWLLSPYHHPSYIYPLSSHPSFVSNTGVTFNNIHPPLPLITLTHLTHHPFHPLSSPSHSHTEKISLNATTKQSSVYNQRESYYAVNGDVSGKGLKKCNCTQLDKQVRWHLTHQ